MDVICDFARQHDLKIIEDCAQSHGAKLSAKLPAHGQVALAFIRPKIWVL